MDRAQRGPCAMTENQVFSHPARPNLAQEVFYHMTNFRDKIA